MARVTALVVAALLLAAPALASDPELPIEHEGTTDQSPTYEGYVREGMATIPAPLVKKIREGGFKVVLTPNITFAEPGMAMVHRFGELRPGDRATAGLCQPHKHRVLLAENGEKPDGTPRPLGRGVVGATRHELGHALDNVLGKVSQGALFKAAHEQDVAAMAPEIREKHRYIISGPTNAGAVVPSNAGRTEAFADVFRVLSTPAAKREKRDLELLSLFPRCRAVVGMLDDGLRRE